MYQRSMNFVVCLAIFATLVACSSGPARGRDSSKPFQAFRFSRSLPATQQERVAKLIGRVPAAPNRAEFIDYPPDVEVDATRRSQSVAEHYSVWLERSVVYAGSYKQMRKIHSHHRSPPVFDVRDEDQWN
jgi:hypothetical protein